MLTHPHLDSIGPSWCCRLLTKIRQKRKIKKNRMWNRHLSNQPGKVYFLRCPEWLNVFTIFVSRLSTSLISWLPLAIATKFPLFWQTSILIAQSEWWNWDKRSANSIYMSSVLAPPLLWHNRRMKIKSISNYLFTNLSNFERVLQN